jgi:hypothetical protein
MERTGLIQMGKSFCLYAVLQRGSSRQLKPWQTLLEPLETLNKSYQQSKEKNMTKIEPTRDSMSLINEALHITLSFKVDVRFIVWNPTPALVKGSSKCKHNSMSYGSKEELP